MKRFIFLMVTVCLFVAVLPMNGQAVVLSENNEDVLYLDDGSYITIEINDVNSRAISSKTASKTYTYCNSSGVVQWKAVLNGTFSYDGTTATCTASICTVSISNDNWYVISKTTSKNGGTANAELTMGLRHLGITTKRESITMRLTCDKNGNLS